MAGRKPKPTALKKLEGNPGKRKLNTKEPMPGIPIGVYTIMEVRSGKGSSAGWGRLKSGIGWISLDFVRRI